jgi:hypothetical protein
MRGDMRSRVQMTDALIRHPRNILRMLGSIHFIQTDLKKTVATGMMLIASLQTSEAREPPTFPHLQPTLTN